MRRRYSIGTITGGDFEADTLGSDPEYTTFGSEAEAIEDVKSLIREWPSMSYGMRLRNAAVWDNEADRVVWRQRS
jgi:hypothetical protein